MTYTTIFLCIGMELLKILESMEACETHVTISSLTNLRNSYVKLNTDLNIHLNI